MRRLLAVVLFAVVVLGLSVPTAAQVAHRHGAYGTFTCTGSAATASLPDDPGAVGVLVYNNGANTFYLGYDSSVTTSTGIPVLIGASMRDSGYSGPIYCITAGTSENARYLRPQK